jgi:hypothetical protein
MTPASILASVRDRGARLFLVDGDQIAVTPRGAVDDGLRAAIRAEKQALVAILKRMTDPPPDPTRLPPPCSTCGGVVFWRRDGEAAMHFAACDRCPDRSRAAWYPAVAADDPLAELFDPDTRAACVWAARLRPAVVGELLTLERTAERLAESGDADAYHAAVAALVDYSRRLRAEYEAHHA